MMGADIDDEVSKGIIPRIVEQIFASILASPGNIEYTVRVSYMEIYMERIRDLLQPQNDNLPVHEEKSRGVYVKGLLEIYVSSVPEVYEVMRRGGMARAVASTNMNQESSRSHSIFVITITQKNVETGSAKSGQLFLVDLAGSEKVGKTGASGQTLEEAKKINKSLSSLGNVINSLTDGKSTHIPYRDSKLTRILQESLGGNSRTTLIINCSPSSYNDAETLGTLRFGMRAKAIKNKAKINAELSPAELKALLKKAQTEVTTYREYLANLEGEVQLWRGGEAVPKEKWAPPLASDSVTSKRAEPKTQRPGTPSLLQADASRSETPSRSDSRMGDRSSTPSVVLDKDERDDFLKRENELQDQVAEKEVQLVASEKSLQEAREELKTLKETNAIERKQNEVLGGEVNELRMQLERVAFEGKEASITMDGLKEANSELTTELDEVKQQLMDLRMSSKETTAVLDEKERKKQERMAQMMAGFDMGDEVFSTNEKKIRACIEAVDSLHQTSSHGDMIAPDSLQSLKAQLQEIQGLIRQAELRLSLKANSDPTSPTTQLQFSDLQDRLSTSQQDYEDLLQSKLSDADIDDVKFRLEKAFTETRSTHLQTIKTLRHDIDRHIAENTRLRSALDDHPKTPLSSTFTPSSPSLSTAPSSISLAPNSTSTLQTFDTLKKSLMRDLQNRCERVVELEISLDETREQYNNVLRSSNSKAQQKKMAFLERNLEQLTQVQRQLVDQNSSLKKEVAMAERKLFARNERIASLEALLGESQERLMGANHKYVFRFLIQIVFLILMRHRFELQIAAVKERLEAAKLGSSRNLASTQANQQPTTNGGFSFGGMGPRIAKPLRGGGAVESGVNGVQAQEKGGRTSWFFDRR